MDPGNGRKINDVAMVERRACFIFADPQFKHREWRASA